jgi:hypothetical protein
MTLNVILDVSFDKMYGWKGIRENRGEVSNTEVYVTDDGTSLSVLKVCCVNHLFKILSYYASQYFHNEALLLRCLKLFSDVMLITVFIRSDPFPFIASDFG